VSDTDLVELARDVDARCRLRGTFVLRSGAVADEYFDKYLFEADSVLLRRVVDRMVSLVPPGTRMLAGLELGGVPLVTMLSSLTGIRRCSSGRKPRPMALASSRRVEILLDAQCSSSRM
jgi:orotate phosphoribosyltransferase